MAAKDEKLRLLLAETDKRERLLRTIMDTVGTGVLAVDAARIADQRAEVKARDLAHAERLRHRELAIGELGLGRDHPLDGFVCLACSGLHFIHKETGKLLGETDAGR